VSCKTNETFRKPDTSLLLRVMSGATCLDCEIGEILKREHKTIKKMSSLQQ